MPLFPTVTRCTAACRAASSPDAKNTNPLGVYKVRERSGKEGLLGLFYMSAGYLIRVKCDV